LLAGSPAFPDARRDTDEHLVGGYGSGFGFAGQIEEVRLYDGVLPAERIDQHYEQSAAAD
jgi:hypothetical protein